MLDLIVLKMQKLRLYLAVAFWVLVFSGLAQILAPLEIAEGSVWGLATGWQREIGFFDLAFGLVIFSAVRAGEVRFQRSVAIAMIALTVLVGTNHLLAVLTVRPAWVHVVFTAVNYAFVAFGCAAVFSSRATEE
jgi:KinB signaling pathway activation protein